MGFMKTAVLLFVSRCLLLGIWLAFYVFQLDLTNYTEPWTSYSLGNFNWDGQRPLKILFMTWGPRGDHQPNIALGLELARRGHHVTVMGMKEYAHLIQRHSSLQYLEIVDSHLWKLAQAFGESQGADFISLTKTYVLESCHEMIPQCLQTALAADV